MSVGIRSARANTAFSASIMRLISPPDATCRNGLTFSPGFAVNRKATRSAPVSVSGVFSRAVSKRPPFIPRAWRAAVTWRSSFLEAARRLAESLFAAATAFLSSASRSACISARRSSRASKASTSASARWRYSRMASTEPPYLRLRSPMAARRSLTRSSSCGSNSRPSVRARTSSTVPSMSARTSVNCPARSRKPSSIEPSSSILDSAPSTAVTAALSSPS